MKVLNAIKNIILSILFVVYFAFVILMTVLVLNFNDYNVTEFGSTSLIIINDEISNESYKKGDLVFVKAPKDGVYAVDMVVTYKSKDGATITHKIVKIERDWWDIFMGGYLYRCEVSPEFQQGENILVTIKKGSIHEEIGGYAEFVVP